MIMMAFWYVGCILYAPYAVADGLILPFIMQPEFFAFFTLLCIAQWGYYERKYPLPWIIISCALLLGLSGAAQAGIALGLRSALNRDLEWPLTLMGILPDAFIAIGFLPQYYDTIYVSGPEGISLPFLLFDTLGALISVIGLAFFPSMDWVAAGMYLAVLILDIGLFLLCFILRARARLLRQSKANAPTALEDPATGREGHGMVVSSSSSSPSPLGKAMSVSDD